MPCVCTPRHLDETNEGVVLRMGLVPAFVSITTESRLKALVLLYCMPTVFRICCLLTHTCCAGDAIGFHRNIEVCVCSFWVSSARCLKRIAVHVLK